MPWQECTTMSLRAEFLALANQPGSNFSELCRRFGISRKTGYKWRQRYREQGASGLAIIPGDRSTRRGKARPRWSKKYWRSATSMAGGRERSDGVKYFV